MDNNTLVNMLLNEHRFWLQIMGDHARFIYYSLAVNETQYLDSAKEFITIFDNLLETARKRASDVDINELNRKVYSSVKSFREFKLKLLTLTLESMLKVHLSSTFFSHMVNELDEYVLTMITLSNGEPALFNPIHYHLLWLSDATGHAAGVMANLDEVEKDLIKKSIAYEKQFTDLYMKSVNLNDYMKSGKTDFPALQRLNIQAETTMKYFKAYLENLRDQRIPGRVLGTLMPLMADHMAREECYYLIKLSESTSNVNNPNCDAGRKRVET